MYIFWIFWGIDALVALVLVCVFFVGLRDGSVAWDNGILCLVLLIGMAAYLLGGYWLFTHQYTIAAILLMAVLVAPTLFYGLYMLLMANGNSSGWK